jgi:hypothetical protein
MQKTVGRLNGKEIKTVTTKITTATATGMVAIAVARKTVTFIAKNASVSTRQKNAKKRVGRCLIMVTVCATTITTIADVGGTKVTAAAYLAINSSTIIVTRLRSLVASVGMQMIQITQRRCAWERALALAGKAMGFATLATTTAAVITIVAIAVAVRAIKISSNGAKVMTCASARTPPKNNDESVVISLRSWIVCHAYGNIRK